MLGLRVQVLRHGVPDLHRQATLLGVPAEGGDTMSCDQEWTPKDGDPFPIHDMADSHLRNAWAALKRREEVGPVIGFPDFRGEMAEEFAESQFFAEADAYQEVVGVLLPALEAEFRRRGMLVRPRRDVDKMFMEGGKV